jgi:hypothetical protein
MIEEVFAQRISEYGTTSELEKWNVVHEILQELALVSLSRAGFFSEAEFHGGTCLRIFRGLDRFSEDLDFALKAPAAGFNWGRYLDRIQSDMGLRGIKAEVIDKSGVDATVKKAFLTPAAIGGILQLEVHSSGTPKKARIKLEVDTNPPAGSAAEINYLVFPEAAAVTIQTLETSFATKTHALLCREYLKGRDWYDFAWYASNGKTINFPHMQNAFRQSGPWAGTQVVVDRDWFSREIGKKIGEVDWKAAREDVARFVPARSQPMLDLWSRHFFEKQLENLLRKWD